MCACSVTRSTGGKTYLGRSRGGTSEIRSSAWETNYNSLRISKYTPCLGWQFCSKRCCFVVYWRVSVQDSKVRWAARDAIVAASRDYEIDGTPSTMLTLELLSMNGHNRFVCVVRSGLSPASQWTCPYEVTFADNC